MTQTLSVVRGTVSSASDGTTRSTLFTNSASVIATRVIVNQLAWYNNVSANGAYKAALIHYNAAGQYSVLGFQHHSYTYAKNFQFNPGVNMPSASWFNSSSGTGTLGVQKIFASGADQIGTSVNAIDSQVMATYNPTSSNFCPGQFWIGPSDVISFAFYSGDGGTGTVGYSFTLISES